MLENCDNKFKFSQFRQIKYTTNNPPIDQIKNKPQYLLINTRRVAKNFIRTGENSNRVSTFKYF